MQAGGLLEAYNEVLLGQLTLLSGATLAGFTARVACSCRAAAGEVLYAGAVQDANAG